MTTPRSNIVRLRLTDLEKADWQKAAGGSRKLSEWIRLVCNAAAEANRVTKAGLDPDPIFREPVPNAKPLIVAAAIQDSVQGEKTAQAGGDHRVAPGPTTRGEDQAHRESRPLPDTQAPGGDSSSGARTSASGSGGETCPRWMHHRPGVYCGACKKVQPKGKR